MEVAEALAELVPVGELEGVAEAVVEKVGVAVGVPVDVAVAEVVRVGVPELVGVGELENCMSCHSIEEACQSLPPRGTTRML